MDNSIKKDEMEEEETVRDSLQGMHLVDPADVKMETDVADVDEEDAEDDTYEFSGQSSSDEDDDIEPDEEMDSAAAEQDERVVALVEEWKDVLNASAEEGYEVSASLTKRRGGGHDEGRLLVVQCVDAFRHLAAVVGQDSYAIISQLASHGKVLHDKKNNFAWFQKADLIDAYLTIGQYAGTDEDVERALGELDDVYDEGKIHVLKLASGLKAQARG